jgi:predicted nucleic acid-binding Zn ribbon protein
MYGGMIGVNPGAAPQPYRCHTCGIDVPPWQHYCEEHQAIMDKREKRPLLDRWMGRFLRNRPEDRLSD